MSRRSARRSARLIVPLAVSGAAVLTGGMALAVSGGGYSPGAQGCPQGADANNFQGAYDGCHNANLVIQDGNGKTYAEAGTYQEAQGDNPHRFGFAVSPDGNANPDGTVNNNDGTALNIDTGWQPFSGSCGLLDELLTPIYVLEGGQPCTDFMVNPPPATPPAVQFSPPGANMGVDPSGLTSGRVYFGADDNLDTGEHDEPNGQNYSCVQKDPKDPSKGQYCTPPQGTPDPALQNGPSDGGAVQVQWSPAAATDYISQLFAVNPTDPTSAAPLAQDPVKVASASTGACADGICAEGTTTRQAVWHGGGGSGDSRDVYNYDSKQWDPYNCSSGSPQDQQSCGKGGEEGYRQQEASNVYAEPGVQVYEDPDPNGSPALPEQFYPLIGLYAGTCGVSYDPQNTYQGSPLQGTPVDGKQSVNPTGC